MKVKAIVVALCTFLPGFVCVDAETYHLRYFNIRGLAEPIRLLLHAAQVPFTETRFGACEVQGGKPNCPEGIEDWPTFKKQHGGSDILPFAQVPSLTVTHEDGSEMHLVQSLAIQQFLGAKLGLGPERAPKHEALANMLAGGLGDMRKRYGKLVYDKAVLTDATLLEEYKGVLRTWLQYFERLLGENQYFMGAQLTYVDTMAFDMLESNLRVDPECLKETPKLAAYVKRVANLPGIKEYLLSDKRISYSNGGGASYDTPDHPIASVPKFFDKDEL